MIWAEHWAQVHVSLELGEPPHASWFRGFKTLQVAMGHLQIRGIYVLAIPVEGLSACQAGLGLMCSLGLIAALHIPSLPM